jgi:CheY-like chemotaxis protein
MAALLHGSLRGEIHLQVDLAEDLWPVMVDPGELELAILNLAVNARDAMSGSGTLAVSGGNVVDGEGAGEFVRLAVRDTGAGMTDEVKARVFEPFFTTKDIGKGSGLGLAQVYGFASQSGGSVAIDSAPGQGTTVTLLLPRSHEAMAEAGDVATHPVAADGPGACVLLVEDDAEVAAFVEELLHRLGHGVVHAASARAALGALADERKVEVVFSDIMMPGGTSGIELAREIRQRRPELPVLLTSGYAGAGGPEAEALGIEILRKPYGIDDLRAALARVRAHHVPAGRASDDG